MYQNKEKDLCYFLTKIKGKDFKILQLTDIHYGAGLLSRKTDKLASEAICRLIEHVKPDFIVLTGDQVYPIPIFSGTINNLKSTKKVISLIEKYDIPWAVVYGNHDVEPFARYKKNVLSQAYESACNCLFTPGDSNLSGEGNYLVKLRNEDGSMNNIFFFMDSNMYLEKSFFSGFDHIHEDQLDWYERELKRIEKEEGKLPQSMCFFHIPCSEYKTAWKEYVNGNKENNVKFYSGECGEINDYFGVPRQQSLFFDRALKLKSTKACFCGHDHLNTTSIEYKGIRLTYGMSIDFLAYKNILKFTSQRGATIISIKDDASFDIDTVKLCDIGGYTIKNKYSK